MKLNGYELSRKWFDFCFTNPELITPLHTALYMFAVEHCNRLGWKEKFGLPTEMAKEAIGVKSWHTYIKAFNDLVDWKFFILIEKSKNQYSSNIIALIKYDEALDEALDKALTKHISKHQRSTYQSNDSIIKLITNNIERITNNYKEFENAVLNLGVIDFIESDNAKDEFETFRKNYPGTKRGLETEFKTFQKHKDWKHVLPMLNNQLSKQIEVRSINKQNGVFVPEWKNLQTYLNQRAWEEELQISTKPQQNGKPELNKIENAFKVYAETDAILRERLRQEQENE